MSAESNNKNWGLTVSWYIFFSTRFFGNSFLLYFITLLAYNALKIKGNNVILPPK